MTIAAATGTRLCGRFTLLGKLGEGGESEVWRARDHQEGKEVALKVLRPEIARRPGTWEMLLREHEIASRLDHPLILKIDSPVRDGDVLALPMELAPGGDLRRLCGVSYLEIVPVLMEVAQALAYAHERGVMHRDLKPGNILFDSRGHVRLADFGTARAGVSPFTASPQQLQGEPPTPADDVYGLGALAYELLSGHPPFYPRFDLRRVLEEPVPALKAAHLAPGRLVTLVMTMLAKQPRARPASMKEVLETLEAALNDTLAFAYDETSDALASTSDTIPQVPELIAKRAVGAGPIPSAGSATRAAEPLAAELPPAEPPALSVRPRHEESPRRPPPTFLAPAQSVPSSSAPTSSVPAISAPAPSAPPPAPQAPTSTPQLFAAKPSPPPVFAPQPSAPPPAPVQHSPAPAPSREAPARPAPPPEWPAAAAGFPHAPAPARDAAAPAASAPLRAERATPEQDLRALWGDIKVERVPSLMRLEPVRRSRWPWALAAALAAVAIAAYLLYAPATAPSWMPPSVARLRSLTPPEMVQAVRSAVEAPLHAMASRQDGATDSGDSAAPAADSRGQAPPSNDESPPATNAAPAGAPPAESSQGTPSRARSAAARAPSQVRSTSARSLAVARSSGSAEGMPPSISPSNAAPTARPVSAQARGNVRAPGGRVGGRAQPGVGPLLVDGRSAEAERDFSRAAQDYSQALALDPSNAEARAGLNRANSAFGAGAYAQAVGAGFAALGAGRLEEARMDFDRARSVEPGDREAELGLRRVSAAMRIRDAALSRSRARAELEDRLQSLVDDPQQLGSAAMRAEAASLIREADAMQSSGGAVLRSLAARLAILLPSYDKLVHLALVSDNVTEVEIPEIGSFGTFARRDIDLKPGRYTVIGTRAGYREVRRSVTVAPGDDIQTISVRCQEPI